MTYEEFEWNLLKLAYEDGLERFQPSFVAYALGLPHEIVTAYLEQGTHAGLLEMEVTDDGRLEYFIPGVDRRAALPQPVWADEFSGLDDDESSRQAARVASDQDGLVALIAGDKSAGAAPKNPGGLWAQNLVSADGPDDGVAPWQPPELPAAPDGAPGPRPTPAPGEPATDGAVLAPRPTITRPGAVAVRGARRSPLPAALRQHIQARYASEDGSLSAAQRAGGVAVLDRNASVHDADVLMVSRELVRADHVDQLPVRVETNLETYSDPSKTIFMRQLKIYGVHSEEVLRAHVERLFTSLGYQPVQVNPQRLRFERGSVTFILALIPLFVLVLPLFVYLFLYCMGRSTIQQEPVELDVQLRRLGEGSDVYEINLTFIGMHGVVLGAADQRVLNQEVDTLRDELQWAMSAG